MESLKNITTNRFDTNNEDLVPMCPYILEEKETGKRMIATLTVCNGSLLTFTYWDSENTNCPHVSISITPNDIEKYAIYKADLSSGSLMILEIFHGDKPSDEEIHRIKNQIASILKLDSFDQDLDNAVIDTINKVNSNKSTMEWSRRIYDSNHDGLLHYVGPDSDIDYDGLSPLFGEAVGGKFIKQFVYKIDVMNNGKENYAKYSVACPKSIIDTKMYLDNGWMIHPMFRTDNDFYEPYIVIDTITGGTPTSSGNKPMSETDVTNGLRLLYLIEKGLTKCEGSYHGIPFEWDPEETFKEVH